MLIFDSSKGFSVSELTDIRDEVAEQWKTAFKKDNTPELVTDPETPAGQLIDSETAAIRQKDAEVAFLANQFNPMTASGKWQDALGKIYFLTRKSAINSSAECVCTGITGTTIEAGSAIRTNDDDTQWILKESVSIGADGTCKGVFECQQEGSVEAGANTLTNIVNVIAGWDSVTNPQAATVGQLVETQAAFEARRYKSVALNARGTCDAVYAQVAQCDDVISVYVTDNKTGKTKTIDSYNLKPHSVYVAVLGGDNDDIANAIYNSLSAGCDYNGNTTVTVTDSNTGNIEDVTFMRPDDFNCYVRVTVQKTDTLPNAYENTIKQAVHANFYGEDETTINGEPMLRYVMNDDVYASRFTVSILNAGINQLLGVEVSHDGKNWVNSLHIPITGAPILDLANISIVLEE